MPAWTRAANVSLASWAAILTSLHMRTADDLFGCPQGSPRTDQLIAASIQWAVTNDFRERDGSAIPRDTKRTRIARNNPYELSGKRATSDDRIARRCR